MDYWADWGAGLIILGVIGMWQWNLLRIGLLVLWVGGVRMLWVLHDHPEEPAAATAAAVVLMLVGTTALGIYGGLPDTSGPENDARKQAHRLLLVIGWLCWLVAASLSVWIQWG